MTSPKPKKSATMPPKAGGSARSASDALRANLQRRKQQGVVRRDAVAPPPVAQGPDGGESAG